MIVSVEGIDGAGKRTLSNNLAKVASGAGVEVRQLSFPRYGRSVTSSSISALLATQSSASTMDARFAAALFASERLEAMPILREAVGNHRLLLVDRYVHSNMAYQVARALPSDEDVLLGWIERLEFGLFDIPRPDLVVLIDVDPATSMARTQSRPLQDGRPAEDKYEGDQMLLEGARRIYLQLCHTDQITPWVLVPQTGGISAEAVASQLWDEHIEAMIGTADGSRKSNDQEEDK